MNKLGILEGILFVVGDEGLTLDQYLKLTNKTMENLRKEFDEQANKAVKSRLVLEAIIKAEDIKPDDKEVEEKVAAAASEEAPAETNEEEPSITIDELELSVRAYNCLKRASINSMAELLKKSEHDLLNIKNFGKKSSDEVIERLHHFGLDLAPNPEVDENGMVIESSAE